MTKEQLKDLEEKLWKAADKLRADSDLKASEYSTPILGLIFLRFASIRFNQILPEIEKEFEAKKGKRDEETIENIAIRKCGFYLPEAARYEYLMNLPNETKFDEAIKNAMQLIEDHKPELRGTLTKDEYFRLTRRNDNAKSNETVSLPKSKTMLRVMFLGKFMNISSRNLLHRKGKVAVSFLRPRAGFCRSPFTLLPFTENKMQNIITEDQIERNIIEVFKTMGYRHQNAFYGLKERPDERETVIRLVLRERLVLLNPMLSASAIDTAVTKLTESRTSQTALQANVVLYDLMKAGVTMEELQANGKTEPKTVKVIDFEAFERNNFLVVSQLYIQGSLRQRPDLIVFVNGLSLIFIELKNSNILIRNAYYDNLTNYKKFIPQLFNHNALLMLSNGIETKVGSITSEWNHFFPWLRPLAENEEPDLKRIKEDGISLEYAVRGLCEPVKFLDYFQNFILYHQGLAKIVAKNHQFLGVNNVIESFKNRLVHDQEKTDTDNKGKLGVFWHTQGSGKSFSMVFLTKKISYKFTGNYTFLIITDREDLDGQIKKNYYKAGVISKNETKSQPASSEALRTKLQENPQYNFTLIHKFRYDKGKAYPVLSTRNDIIVIVDEAHRTQYKDLAENMRKGLPNAQFLAFTGTPLLGSKKLTNRWFGKLVSEYNFKQSIEDGAMVPLFYQNRKPKVNLQNDELNDEFAEIVNDEELDEDQLEKLEREYAKELSVIRADDRLNTIAEDIVKHFPRRGYLGKAMVISIDKFTAVRINQSFYFRMLRMICPR